MTMIFLRRPAGRNSAMQFYKKKTITRGNYVPYLIRYSIFTCRWFAIKVHNILLSDDACLHNHPWAFVTILLSGGYFEESEHKGKTDFKYHRAPSILFRPAAWSHRLELRKPMWTLVITFKKVQDWGFFTPRGFVNWRDYWQDSEGRCE